MPAQERGPYPHHEDLTEEHSLIDDLAKGLAGGILSRGRMLKLATLTLLGGTFGIFGSTSPVQARQRRRSRCVPCNIAPPFVYPQNTCCMYTPGSEVGCLAARTSCESGSLPGGLQCICGELG